MSGALKSSTSGLGRRSADRCGIDNMHAFRTMSVSGGPTEYNVSTRPCGGFPHLLAAMENAAAATWMLAPDGRAERDARYL